MYIIRLLFLLNSLNYFRTLSWSYFNFFFPSLFSLLSKKHNKVLEQATQSLRGSLGSNDSPLPDYVSIKTNVVMGASKFKSYIPKSAKNSQSVAAEQPPTSKYRNLYEWCHVWNISKKQELHLEMAEQNHNYLEGRDLLSTCAFQAICNSGYSNHTVENSIFKNWALTSTES